MQRVLLLGPARTAVSGVATHLNQLFGSELASRFRLFQFQVGSEGRSEGRAGVLMRVILSPFTFAACMLHTRPRIVHINTSFEPKGYWRDLIYLTLAKLARRKVVYQIHGGALPAEFFAGNAALTAFLRRVISCPDAVVLLATSELRAYREFAPRARLVRIANAVAPCEPDLRAERYVNSDPLAVAYLGRLAANKGIFETLEAMRILRERGIAARLTIAGSGAAAAAVRARIAAGGLEDCVHFAGAVFGAEKARLWQQSQVLAFPTYHREGLPYSLLEAMSCGVVPVISPVGGIADVMQDAVQGLFVPPHDAAAVADALQRLAADRALLHRMALAARARVIEQYSVQRLATEFAHLYQSLA
ncbi:MAG TPA: glycosyltransferase family 4 protein [Steroidobacteraceae bacterium]|nr:glycosyltransferase family 4 protein [Steroidobacteraceae bacterium]